ncbi:MAG: NAD(P)H-dependent oxidoreductase [Cypionkella sp.]
MQVLIFYAQPEPTSFNAAMKNLAVETLTAQGHSVVVSDLFAMGWNAAAGPQDVTGTISHTTRFSLAREQTPAMEQGNIAAEQARLTAAVPVIFQLPIWWFGMPAILKGWADRIFAYLPGQLDAKGRAQQLDWYRKRLETLKDTMLLFFHPAIDHGPDERLKPGVLARSGVQRNV